MRRAFGWATALFALLVVNACSRDWESFGVGAGTGGAAGADAGIGGGGVGVGTCFPGAKVCPDPENAGELLCLTAEAPDFGCGKTTSCSPCAMPHAKARCTSGMCAIDTCDAGWADCNSDPADGCEVDLTGDKNHCGSCATDCVATKGVGWICAAGQCEVNGCCPNGEPACSTLRDCDGNKTNGCEADIDKDANNCSSCGNACALAHAKSTCNQGACAVISCTSGWANCDKSDANGCETDVSQGDKANCGACGKVCAENNGGATCTQGSCVFACNPGFANCDLAPENGCETSTGTNPLHCGGCSKPCNPLNAVSALCSNGSCTYDSCKPGFTNCDSNAANGCEINTAQDKNNCGVCGKVCQAPTGGAVVCSNGSCAQSCAGALTNCSGLCVNVASDVNHCGACGNKCSAPANATATCSGSACGFTCNNGFHKCGTQCRADNDATACGASCAVCPGPTAGIGVPSCFSGVCSVQCQAPTTGKCGTGCYDLTSDKNHCGSCTTVCANACVNAVCT